MSGHSHHHPVGIENRGSLGGYIFRIVVSLFIVSLLLLYGVTFQVSESESAVITRFGNPIRKESESGLHWKLPWPVDTAHIIDMRKRNFNTPHAATFTKDKKNIIMMLYGVWQVTDPVQFLKTYGTVDKAESRLRELIIHQNNFHMGKYELSSLVSTDETKIHTPEIEKQVCEAVNKDVEGKFGVKMLQVGVKRVSLPEANLQAILDHMSQERQAEADRIRAEGVTQAKRIMNEAEVASEETIKEGTIQAGEITANAHKESSRIYADMYGLDPDFYRFWSTLRFLRESIGPRTTIILRNDSSVFAPIFGVPEIGTLPGMAPVKDLIPEKGVKIPDISSPGGTVQPDAGSSTSPASVISEESAVGPLMPGFPGAPYPEKQ